jgi:hypothetical protein
VPKSSDNHPTFLANHPMVSQPPPVSSWKAANSKSDQAGRKYQQIINRFPVIINMPSCVTTTCPVGGPGPQGADGSEPSDNRPISRRNRPMLPQPAPFFHL